MQVDLVSPEKLLASVEADSVSLPGADGDFVAMPGHVPTATSLRPGIVSVMSGGSATDYLIAGGFAEISDAGVSVLAEFAAPAADASAEMFQPSLDAAERAVQEAAENDRAEAERRYGALKDAMSRLSM